MDRRPEARRTDAWGDFLRRTMLTIGMAGAAALPPAKAATPPAAEVGDQDPAVEIAPPVQQPD